MPSVFVWLHNHNTQSDEILRWGFGWQVRTIAHLNEHQLGKNQRGSTLPELLKTSSEDMKRVKDLNALDERLYAHGKVLADLDREFFRMVHARMQTPGSAAATSGGGGEVTKVEIGGRTGGTKDDEPVCGKEGGKSTRDPDAASRCGWICQQ